jgi:hypothetical protein
MPSATIALHLFDCDEMPVVHATVLGGDADCRPFISFSLIGDLTIHFPFGAPGAELARRMAAALVEAAGRLEAMPLPDSERIAAVTTNQSRGITHERP